MKKLLIIALLSTLVLTGCGSKNKEEKTNEEIGTCKDCVYAYYTDVKAYGEDGDVLTDYTKDYTTLKDENSNQRTSFLGHMLDENGKIKRAFVCAIEGDKIYCIEGTSDGSKYNSNKEVIKGIYDESKCEEEDTYYSCQGDRFVEISENGLASIDDDTGCTVFSINNTMGCY